MTGLVWALAAGGANPCPSDGTGVCTWADAAGVCAAQNAASLGGLSSGWHLPSVVELLSLVNYANTPPLIDTTVFTGATASPYWTSTAAAGSSTQAWSINLQNGSTSVAATTQAMAILCVN